MPNKYIFLSRVCLLVTLFCSDSFIAQEKCSNYSDQYWFQYYGQLNLTNKWSAALDGGVRKKKKCSEKAATLGRVAVQYQINNYFSASIGGAYFSQYANEQINREEWRGYQELFFKHNLSRFFISHRLRLEERYFHSLATGKDNFNFRLRYRFYFTIPLNHADMQAKTLYLIAGDEVFFNFGKDVIYNYEQNRVITGLGFKPLDNLMINFTYVYQYAQKNCATNFENSDILWLGIIHTINFNKNSVSK